MPSFNKHADLLAFLCKEIGARYRPPAGALFTVALLPVEGAGLFFATGKVVLLDEETTARGSLVYPAMTLAEEWTLGADAALERLRLLLEGDGRVADQPVHGRFGGTYGERNAHALQPRFTPWAEWALKTSWHHESPRPSFNNDPVIAFGLPPFQSTRAAASEWVHSRIYSQGLVIHENELITVLPDTRARIADARWDREEVVVAVEANCPREQLELQAVFGSKKERYHSTRAPEPEVRLRVQGDADEIWLALVHSSGARLGETFLNEAYRSVAERTDTSPFEEQVRRDLLAGENERVEYKPFVKRGDSKEMEVVETVIAFGNTQGGRVLLGVDDNRRLLGHGHMTAMLPPNERGHDPLTRLRDWAHKLLSDRCKPVPPFSVHLFEIDGDPVGIIDVKRGDERPYCVQHRNLVFVRKGGSNVIPDPKTEWAAFFGPVAVPGAFFGTDPFATGRW